MVAELLSGSEAALADLTFTAQCVGEGSSPAQALCSRDDETVRRSKGAGFLDRMCLALRASGLCLRYAALQNLILSFPWISPPPSTPAQPEEKKGSNFAIWQPWYLVLPCCLRLSFRLVPSCVASPSVFSPSRYITILTPEDPARAASDDIDVIGEEDDRIDLRTLRAIRVLRPLKLVSGVPSKQEPRSVGRSAARNRATSTGFFD